MLRNFFNGQSLYGLWTRHALLALAASASLVLTGLRADLTKSDWAAWVQAAGSIAAIAVAFWIPWRASQHAKREQQQRMLEKMNLAWLVIEHAHVLISEATKAVNDPLRVRVFANTFLADVYENAERALWELPLDFEAPTRIAQHIFFARHTFAAAKANLAAACPQLGSVTTMARGKVLVAPLAIHTQSLRALSGEVAAETNAFRRRCKL